QSERLVPDGRVAAHRDARQDQLSPPFADLNDEREVRAVGSILYRELARRIAHRGGDWITRIDIATRVARGAGHERLRLLVRHVSDDAIKGIVPGRVENGAADGRGFPAAARVDLAREPRAACRSAAGSDREVNRAGRGLAGRPRQERRASAASAA